MWVSEAPLINPVTGTIQQLNIQAFMLEDELELITGER